MSRHRTCFDGHRSGCFSGQGRSVRHRENEQGRDAEDLERGSGDARDRDHGEHHRGDGRTTPSEQLAQGLAPQDQFLLGTGGSGLNVTLGPDTRISNVTTLRLDRSS